MDGGRSRWGRAGRLALAWAALGATWGPACRGAAGPEAEAKGIVVDRERREVSFPFSFVNPSRMLEVVACSPTGPTHETLIAIPVSGTALRRALLGIGLEPADRWKVGGEGDFIRTQGSRAVLLLRWTWKGRTCERAVEELIRRAGEAWPEFIRGFSFLAEGAEGASEAIEFTLGARGSGRSSAAYALLVHATSFPFLLPWTSDPEIDPDALPDLDDLVDRRVRGTATIRPVTETALVALRRARRPDWSALHDEIAPIAREIDALKAEYAGIRADLDRILAGDPGGAAPALRARTERLAARARVIAARIHVLYMRTYDAECRFQIRRLRSLGGERAEIADELDREHAIGLAYALRRARIEREREEHAARLLEARGEAAAREKHLLAAAECRLRALFQEWTGRRARADRETVLARIAAEKNPFVLKLLRNDVEKLQAQIVLSEGERRIAEACVRREELLAKAPISAEAEASIRKLEASGRRAIERGNLLKRRAELEERIRWREDDLQSPRKDVRDGAREKLAALRRSLAEVEERLRAFEARDEPETGDAKPSPGDR